MKCVARCTSFFIDDTLLQKRFEIHCFLYVRVGKFEDVYSLCTFIKHLVSCGGHNWLLYFPREENIFFSGEKTLDMSPVHFLSDKIAILQMSDLFYAAWFQNCNI